MHTFIPEVESLIPTYRLTSLPVATILHMYIALSLMASLLLFDLDLRHSFGYLGDFGFDRKHGCWRGFFDIDYDSWDLV